MVTRRDMRKPSMLAKVFYFFILVIFDDPGIFFVYKFIELPTSDVCVFFLYVCLSGRN